ncbi:MAG: MFS transporter [Anaerolineales bacterium]|nr:MFS transporter [Anaerolineales bacterium]
MTNSTSPENTPQKKWTAPFFTIWTGQAISLLGSQMVQFALIWWLTKKTGSATVLTTATLVGILPSVVLGPFVGALVDRWNRRKILIIADSSIAFVTLILVYLFSIELVEIWIIYLMLFLRALGGGFHGPAMTASTSLMVPDEHLTRIQGANQTLYAGLNIVSAPLGALLLDLLDVKGVLLIDVFSALFAIVPLFFISIPQPEKKSVSQEKNMIKSVWQDFLEGLQYVKKWPGLLFLIVMALSINMIITPAFSLLPLLVRSHFGGDALQLGWLNSSFGIGAVVGGVLLGVWGGFKKKIHTTLLGLIFLAIGLAVMGLTPGTLLPMAIAGIFIVGIGIPMANGPLNAIVQAAVDPSMQGRVITLLSSLTTAMSPLGLIVAGPISDLVSIQIWYIVGSIVTLGFGIGGFFSKALMKMEENNAST